MVAQEHLSHRNPRAPSPAVTAIGREARNPLLSVPEPLAVGGELRLCAVGAGRLHSRESNYALWNLAAGRTARSGDGQRRSAGAQAVAQRLRLFGPHLM